MIKECKVIYRNSDVMLVEYDGCKIQIPTDNETSEFVYVKKQGDKYGLSNKSELDKLQKKQTKKVESKVDDAKEGEAEK